MEDENVSSVCMGMVRVRKNGGKNEPNQTKVEAEIRREQERKAQQDVEPAQEFPVPVDYGDGSVIIKHWVLLHPNFLGYIEDQTRDDCWALALSKILEFSYNKDRPTGSHKHLDVERFIREVKLSITELKANKKLDHMELAVGSLKKAMDHLYNPGIGKKDGKKGPRAYALRSDFRETENATAAFIVEKLETKGLVGIIVDADPGFCNIKNGVLLLRKSPREYNCPRHALIIVAYGSMKDGKLFFVLQNSWGVTWGVNGYGRVIIEEPCTIFYLEKILKK